MPEKKGTQAAVSELILFNDAALRKGAAKDGDAFALDRRLKPIYEAVLSPTTETPFSVMVSGGWGTGKTSSMRRATRSGGSPKSPGLGVPAPPGCCVVVCFH